MDKHTPDPKTHKQISIIKSITRIVAGLMFCYNEVVLAGILLIVAELLGIAEELV